MRLPAVGEVIDQRTLTAVIPCRDPRFLSYTIASLLNQTRPPDKILVVADGVDLGEFAGESVDVIPNTGPRGKANCINLAVKTSVTTDLVLAVDADTTLQARALEVMVDLLHGEIRIVLPSLHPARMETWIERNRHDWYERVRGKGRVFGVVGCAFVANRGFLLRNPIPPETMVEDQHMSWLLKRAGHAVLQSQFAQAYTEEPRTLGALFRQMTRWSFGSMQLDAIKSRGGLLEPVFFIVFWSVPVLAPYLAGALGWVLSIAFLLVFCIGRLPGTFPYPSAMLYSFVYSLSALDASFRRVLRRPPRW